MGSKGSKRERATGLESHTQPASEAEAETAQPGETGATPLTSPPALISANVEVRETALLDGEGSHLDAILYPEVIPDLTILAERINASFGEVVGSYRTTIVHAFRVGHYLLQAKKLVEPKGFTKWLKENCRGISVSTAREYMRAVKKVHESKRPIDLQMSGAEHQPAGVQSLKEFLKQTSKPRAKRPAKPRSKEITGKVPEERPEPGKRPCPTCEGRGYLIDGPAVV